MCLNLWNEVYSYSYSSILFWLHNYVYFFLLTYSRFFLLFSLLLPCNVYLSHYIIKYRYFNYFPFPACIFSFYPSHYVVKYRYSLWLYSIFFCFYFSFSRFYWFYFVFNQPAIKLKVLLKLNISLWNLKNLYFIISKVF